MIYAIVALIAYSLVLLIMITVIRVPRAGGYEISIYDVYPMHFWLSIIVGTILGKAMMIKHRNSHWSDMCLPVPDSRPSSAFLRFPWSVSREFKYEETVQGWRNVLEDIDQQL